MAHAGHKLRIGRGLGCVGVLVLALGCAGRRDAARTMEPRASAIPAAAAARAIATTPPGPCREQLRRELESGRRLDGRCAEPRERVTESLLSHRRAQRFGVVDHQEVDLVGIELRVSEASRCRRWPLRDPSKAELDANDAERQRCRLRPYRGSISVAAIGVDGRRYEHVVILHADRDGRAQLVFAEVDGALRATNRGSLDDFRALEIGRGAWAGSVDLDRLRSFTADWHYRWVQAGRGAPALFAHRHREHPHAADAEALAVESRIARQRGDLAAVEAGRLSPRAFLERHVWSPFRRKVEQMAAGQVLGPPANRGSD